MYGICLQRQIWKNRMIIVPLYALELSSAHDVDECVKFADKVKHIILSTRPGAWNPEADPQATLIRKLHYHSETESGT